MTKKLSVLAVLARVLIGAAAILHLILCNVHTKALLLLVNEICGFVMFIFVLMGLIALFECTQIKPGKKMPAALTIFFCLGATGMGALLNNIYYDAIAHQPQLNVEIVSRAVTLSWGMMAVFTAAAVLLVVDMIRTRKDKSSE